MSGGRETVEAEKVSALLEGWVAAGNSLDALGENLARQARRLKEQRVTSLEVADKLLLAVGLEHRLREIAPPPKPKRSGLWAKPHPLRRLTEEQVRAAHRLHLEGGISIRELGRQLYERLGYSTPQSCSMALIQAFRRAGLPRRNRIEATVKASTVHGRGSRADKAAYKRWHRATFGPWPSDRRRTAL